MSTFTPPILLASPFGANSVDGRPPRGRANVTVTTQMKTRVDEIADRVFRISTFVPEVGPDGFTLNQFLLRAEQPLLFHCGPSAIFADVAEAAARIMRLERLRWIAFGHVEADECGALDKWLTAAPEAELAAGRIGAEVSIADMTSRAVKAMDHDQVLDLGDMAVRHLDTPHVPHGWDARLLFEETTGTLLCGDLFTQLGDGPPVCDDDIVERSFVAADLFDDTCLTPSTAPTIRQLAALSPATLATMHGSSFAGDCVEVLEALADGFERRLLSAMP